MVRAFGTSQIVVEMFREIWLTWEIPDQVFTPTLPSNEEDTTLTEQRYPIYRPIHKAIRHILFSTSHQVGLADFTDDAVTLECLAGLDRTVGFLREHKGYEDAHIHRALERKLPGITATFAEDHEEDEKLLDLRDQLGTQIKNAGEAQRVALGIELHERFNAYVGMYLGHLYREETELQKVLWDNFTDAELIAMRAAIVRDLPPGRRVGEFLPEMCASDNPDEISLVLKRVKANAPPEVFQRMTQLAESVMQPAMWAKVRARIA